MRCVIGVFSKTRECARWFLECVSSAYVPFNRLFPDCPELAEGSLSKDSRQGRSRPSGLHRYQVIRGGQKMNIHRGENIGEEI
jgi:hypothetical protein